MKVTILSTLAKEEFDDTAEGINMLVCSFISELMVPNLSYNILEPAKYIYFSVLFIYIFV